MRKSYLLTLRNPVGGEVVAYVNASGPKAAAFVVDVALKPLSYLNTPLSTPFKIVGVEEWSHGKSRVLSGAKRFGLYYHHSAMRGADVVQGVAGIKTAINAYMKTKESNYSPNMVYFLYDLDEYKRP